MPPPSAIFRWAVMIIEPLLSKAVATKNRRLSRRGFEFMTLSLSFIASFLSVAGHAIGLPD
jgi:hypothetical protein